MVGQGRVMYCHPSSVKKWSKAMKPKATPAQLLQALLMREAKAAKLDFFSRQQPFFKRDGSAVTQ